MALGSYIYVAGARDSNLTPSSKTYRLDPTAGTWGDTAIADLPAARREAAGDLYLNALVEIGLVLLIVTVMINALSRLLIWRVSRPRTVKARTAVPAAATPAGA